MKKLITSIVLSIAVIFFLQSNVVDAAVSVFKSAQVGTTPANGECLTTDGTNSTWGSCSGGGSSKWTDATTYIYPTGGIYASAPYFVATSTTATSTFPNATTSRLSVSKSLNIFGTIGTALSDFCTAITGGAGLCDGTDADTTYTAGDALTLTGNDIDFDGGTVPAGALGGTWASPTVDDDGHAHTGTTLSGIDISADTNLTADGTEIVLTGDALSLGTQLTFTAATTSHLYASTLATTTSLFAKAVNLGSSILSIASNILTGLGVWDLGGADSLEIPNGTGPTVDAAGETAVDTTSDQFVYYGASAKKVLGDGNSYPAFSYATSTAWTGTTTIPLGVAFTAETWNAAKCFTDTGTLITRFGDGTNWTNANQSSTTVGTTAFTSNNTFTAAEKRYVEVGTPASTPTKISCTVSKSITAD